MERWEPSLTRRRESWVKVSLEPTLGGFEASFNHADSMVPWATAARGKKRKRMRDDGGDDSDAAPSDAHGEV